MVIAMGIMDIIAMVMPLTFTQMTRLDMVLLSQQVIEKKENLEEIGRKEPLRCFTRHDLQAHQMTVAKQIAAQPRLPIAAQSILHDLLDLIHQLALPLLALAHPLVHRVEDARHVENNLTLPH